MSGFLGAIDVLSRGLSVQRTKMNAVAENMANAETVETPDGGPYRRKRVMVTEEKTQGSFNSALKKETSRLARTHSGHLKGHRIQTGRKSDVVSVSAREVQDDESAFKLVHDPGHPKANAEGYVQMPDIDIIEEMVDMMAASRAYEANTVAVSAAKRMVKDALDI